MSSYKELADSVTAGSGQFTSARVCTKFCSMGLVASKKWADTFITIRDGYLKLYDSEDTFRTNPTNFVMEIHLDRSYTTSQTRSKDYSQRPGNVAIINYMYLQIDNGIFSPYRVLKIGSVDTAVLDKLRRGVNDSTGASTQSNVAV